MSVIKIEHPSGRSELKAVILAGGLGLRLRPLTSDKPKPLIEVANKSILEWQIEWLKSYGVKELILCVGHLKEKVIEVLGSGLKYGVKIAYVVEEAPLGTGGALKNAASLLGKEDCFLICNGDIITSLNPLRLIEPLKRQALGAIAAVPLKSPYGVLEIGDEGSIKSFVEKPVLKQHWINAGIYAFKPEVLQHLPDKGDMEKVTLPTLAREEKLKVVRYERCFWKSIDTYKDVKEAEKELRTATMFKSRLGSSNI
jgi:NDP-sugar pyrophosphorylase family protein